MIDQATFAPRPRCPVCKSPHKAQIHALIASKLPYGAIHLATQQMGQGIKRETIGKHVRICLGGVKPMVDEEMSQAIADASRDAASQAESDFAVLVQRRAVQMLKDGQLRVTAQHGLQAQALLDRRLEKAADRDLMVNMARLLSGAIAMTPTEVIEGRVVEVRDLLAPGEVVDAAAGLYEGS